jgi:pimeloyl-ACP methyl ester carboxylesterase
MHLAAIGLIALGLAVPPPDDISLQPAKGDRVHSAWQRSLAQLNRPSPRTEETLRRFDLADRYRKDARRAIASLEVEARRAPEPELIFALAELSWLEGRRCEGRRRSGDQALRHYVDTVAYAFDFLFDPELAAGRTPTDPRFRIACDLYNAALDRLLRAARTGKGRLQPGDKLELTIQGDAMTMELALWPQTPWKADDIDELILASDFEVAGLDGLSHRYGLGVPLIAVRRARPDRASDDAAYPELMAFPITAVLRPNRPLRDASNADVEQARRCTIDLVDPVTNRTVGTGACAIPIEADVTTPLAYMWSKTDLNKYRWSGLLRPGKVAERAGLLSIRPYEPGKIPVVMVHGLLSSPLAWIPMLNELLRDPEIQERYQFFLYLYPTGMPIPIAAAGLRDALRDLYARFPSDSDARDRMVILGHSMGGLLAHAMAVRSDDHFWKVNSDRGFEKILGPADVLAELRHYTFFDWQPYVRRVVFLATPHRGSDYSRKFVGRLGSNLITEPDRYTKLLGQLVKDNPDAFPARFAKLPTSIETLEPDSPILQALLRMKANPETRFDSIIGSLRPDNVESTTDGVVPYRSAHLDGVDETIVRSDHGVQRDPEAIQAVRRILKEHLRSGEPMVQAAVDSGAAR